MHSTLAMFMYMLIKASYKPCRIGMVDLDRGQFCSGRFKLSEALELSEQSVRTCLANLHELGMITSKSTNKYTVYTIVNYGQYQDIDDSINQQINQQSTSSQPTTNQQLTTIKDINTLSIKKETTLSEYSDEFKQFWAAYPNKTGKGGAYQSWKKQKPKIELVISALSWQSKTEAWTKENGRFCPMATTYLNQRRWEDEPYGVASKSPLVCPKGYPFSAWKAASESERAAIVNRSSNEQ